MASNEHNFPGGTPAKPSSDYVEEKDIAVNADPTMYLPESHKAYLIERHGTLDLDPIPSMDPADPYNWAVWKVRNSPLSRFMSSRRRLLTRFHDD